MRSKDAGPGRRGATSVSRGVYLLKQVNGANEWWAIGDDGEVLAVESPSPARTDAEIASDFWGRVHGMPPRPYLALISGDVSARHAPRPLSPALTARLCRAALSRPPAPHPVR